jgi:hypothetical protein
MHAESIATKIAHFQTPDIESGALLYTTRKIVLDTAFRTAGTIMSSRPNAKL